MKQVTERLMENLNIYYVKNIIIIIFSPTNRFINSIFNKQEGIKGIIS